MDKAITHMEEAVRYAERAAMWLDISIVLGVLALLSFIYGQVRARAK